MIQPVSSTAITATTIAVTITGAAGAPLRAAGDLGRYFTPGEIATYKLKAKKMRQVAARDGEQNRLTDPGHKRCGNDVVPVSACPKHQKLASSSRKRTRSTCRRDEG
jgi:hypothetical protein